MSFRESVDYFDCVSYRSFSFVFDGNGDGDDIAVC
jgi:hypothetical protein